MSIFQFCTPAPPKKSSSGKLIQKHNCQTPLHTPKRYQLSDTPIPKRHKYLKKSSHGLSSKKKIHLDARSQFLLQDSSAFVHLWSGQRPFLVDLPDTPSPGACFLAAWLSAFQALTKSWGALNNHCLSPALSDQAIFRRAKTHQKTLS